MNNTTRAAVAGIQESPASDRPHVDDPATPCSECGGPIAKGEGRYRLTTHVYHVRCWEELAEGLVG